MRKKFNKWKNNVMRRSERKLAAWMKKINN